MWTSVEHSEFSADKRIREGWEFANLIRLLHSHKCSLNTKLFNLKTYPKLNISPKLLRKRLKIDRNLFRLIRQASKALGAEVEIAKTSAEKWENLKYMHTAKIKNVGENEKFREGKSCSSGGKSLAKTTCAMCRCWEWVNEKVSAVFSASVYRLDSSLTRAWKPHVQCVATWRRGENVFLYEQDNKRVCEMLANECSFFIKNIYWLPYISLPCCEWTILQEFHPFFA